MMMGNKGRTAWAVMALVALTLCSGCGSDDDNPPNSPPPGGSNAFDSGSLAADPDGGGILVGGSFTKVLPNASSGIGYHCNFHGAMTGTVVVATGQADSVVVQIVNSTATGFQPQSVSVRPGGSVRWVNADGTAHTATSH